MAPTGFRIFALKCIEKISLKNEDIKMEVSLYSEISCSFLIYPISTYRFHNIREAGFLKTYREILSFDEKWKQASLKMFSAKIMNTSNLICALKDILD